MAACTPRSDVSSLDPSPAATIGSPPADDPADGNRIGGPDTGFSIEIPEGWVEFDLTSEDWESIIDDAGLSGEVADLLPQMVSQIAGMNGFFAVDVPATTGLGGMFAVNTNGFCAPSLGTPDLMQLAEASRSQFESIGAEDFVVAEATIGTTDAARVSYTLAMGQAPAVGVQFMFVGPDRQVCHLTFSTTPDDEDTGRFDDIAGTVRLEE